MPPQTANKHCGTVQSLSRQDPSCLHRPWVPAAAHIAHPTGQGGQQGADSGFACTSADPGIFPAGQGLPTGPAQDRTVRLDMQNMVKRSFFSFTKCAAYSALQEQRKWQFPADLGKSAKALADIFRPEGSSDPIPAKPEPGTSGSRF